MVRFICGKRWRWGKGSWYQQSGLIRGTSFQLVCSEPQPYTPHYTMITSHLSHLILQQRVSVITVLSAITLSQTHQTTSKATNNTPVSQQDLNPQPIYYWSEVSKHAAEPCSRPCNNREHFIEHSHGTYSTHPSTTRPKPRSEPIFSKDNVQTEEINWIITFIYHYQNYY